MTGSTLPPSLSWLVAAFACYLIYRVFILLLIHFKEKDEIECLANNLGMTFSKKEGMFSLQGQYQSFATNIDVSLAGTGRRGSFYRRSFKVSFPHASDFRLKILGSFLNEIEFQIKKNWVGQNNLKGLEILKEHNFDRKYIEALYTDNQIKAEAFLAVGEVAESIETLFRLECSELAVEEKKVTVFWTEYFPSPFKRQIDVERVKKTLNALLPIVKNRGF